MKSWEKLRWWGKFVGDTVLDILTRFAVVILTGLVIALILAMFAPLVLAVD